jgi:hypothetical protein
MAKVKKQRGLADGLSQKLLLMPLLGWALNGEERTNGRALKTSLATPIEGDAEQIVMPDTKSSRR